MFLENDYARPLFDFKKGGAPKAFECLMCRANDFELRKCGKITRTERGMRMHLKSVHGWEEQACLYSMDKPNEEKKENQRKLRLFTKENIAATTKRSLTQDTEQEVEAQPALLQLTEPEMKEKESLKPTREEK
jgi:hypothetical protein